MDLTEPADVVPNTPIYSGDLGDVDNWDELQARCYTFVSTILFLLINKRNYLQDKILRVLNYKYHGTEFLYLYYNEDYDNWDTISQNQSDDEKEMETQILQDYDELPKITEPVPPELTVHYSVIPSRQYVEIVHIADSSRASRIWKSVKGFFTLESCRNRQ